MACPFANESGCDSGPISESNFFEWEALIKGPDDTPFEGGVFSATLSFPRDYPLNAPKVSYITVEQELRLTQTDTYCPYCPDAFQSSVVPSKQCVFLSFRPTPAFSI
jgi:ubiquitin-protein ligase